ncbi:MAG: OmpH family outer membrane protein [Pseudomonadota bacterium]
MGLFRPGWPAALALGFCLFAGELWAQSAPGNSLVVSRTRILSETVPARDLRERETDLRGDFRLWVQAHQQLLDAEELRLTELRDVLPKDEFEVRTTAFDQKVRAIRRETQSHEAAIQAAFREARKNLLTALYPILIDVLKVHGASVIIDADQILIAAPEADVTDEVIERYNAEVELIDLPNFEDLGATLPEETGAQQPRATPGQQ